MSPDGHAKIKMAMSRMLIVACQMRFWRLGAEDSTRGGGDLLVLMSVHLNNMTAKKAIQKGGESLKLFFDELAYLIMAKRVRILGGDWNMAMWKVVGELLARGIQVNLVAWYPWQMQLEDKPRIDSEAILIIGPCSGVRMIYDCSIFGLRPPTRPESWSKIEYISRDEQGKETKRESFKLVEFAGHGQGYPLTAYHPK